MTPYEERVMLPDDLKTYSAPKESWWRVNRDKVVGGVCAILFLAYWLGSPVPDAAAVQVNQDLPIVTLAERQASLIAACMNSGGWTWKDPHTGDYWATFCDSQRISRPM